METITKVSETQFEIIKPVKPVILVETIESVKAKILTLHENRKQAEADLSMIQNQINKIDNEIAEYESYIASAKAKGVKEEVKDDIITSEELN